MSKEYRDAMREWRKSLTPQQIQEARAEALANGFKGDIFEPVDPYAQAGSTGFDHDASSDATQAAPEQQQTTTDEAFEARESIMRVILEIKSAENPRRKADELCTAFGFNVQMGETMTSMAAKYSCTKAAFSKSVINLCKRYGVDPSKLMKSSKAVVSYRFANKPRSK